MTKMPLIGLLLLASIGAFAKDIPEHLVPSVVVNSFKQTFPKASHVEWELKKGGIYEVEFDLNFYDEYEALYTPEGKLLRYEVEIHKKDLPEAIVQRLQQDFLDYHIDDVEKIVENEIETYRVEIEKGKEERHLHFSSEGEIL